jgi:hypothetical protein
VTKIRVRHVIVVGVAIAVATAAHAVAVTWRYESTTLPVFFSRMALAVGGPLCLPWFVLWSLEPAPRDRALDLFEAVSYGLLALCELGVFLYLPGALEPSEGFILLFEWGGSAVATILLILVNELGKPPP